MDPITALSIIGNIVQIMDFGIQVAKLHQQLRDSLDIIAVHEITPNQQSIRSQVEHVKRVAGSLEKVIEGSSSRLLVFGYNAGSDSMDGDKQMEYRYSHAEQLLKKMEETRTSPEERRKPLILLGYDTGALIIEMALDISRKSSAKGSKDVYAISQSTYATLYVDTQNLRNPPFQGYRETCYSADQVVSSRDARTSRPLLASGPLPARLFNRIACESDSRSCYVRRSGFGMQRCRYGHRINRLLLPTIQLVCTAIMGNYSRSILRPSEIPSLNATTSYLGGSDQALKAFVPAADAGRGGRDKLDMLWQCVQINEHWPVLARYLNLAKHCGSNIPSFLRNPSTTLFVFTFIAYGVSAISFYEVNSSHHRYQRYFLTAGIIAGIAVSLYLHSKDTLLNVVTTVMPTSITVFLVLSGMVHGVLGGKPNTAEEEICRVIERWVGDVVVAGDG
ncbi:hypothetical protein G7Y89_g987 [Cudoniella acicularis]|uniref:GPI inositol-deacylase n=1 Tax=Cudoniella acicularis TaxID=354080 RepID=A0A8H4RX55_9HELO|nr:hypothetical protein G7Y89_g987 [Cudoniella acicularis]